MPPQNRWFVLFGMPFLPATEAEGLFTGRAPGSRSLLQLRVVAAVAHDAVLPLGYFRRKVVALGQPECRQILLDAHPLGGLGGRRHNIGTPDQVHGQLHTEVLVIEHIGKLGGIAIAPTSILRSVSTVAYS